MKTLLTSLFLLLTFASTASADSEYRIFTNNFGVEIEARIVEVNHGSFVTIVRRDGRRFTDVAIIDFSEADQKYIKNWAKKQEEQINSATLTADSPITIQVSTDKDRDDNNYGDIDDQIVIVEPEVRLKNDDLYKSFKDVRGELLIVGQGAVQKSAFVVLSKQKFVMDVPAKDESRWEGESIKFRYDPDYGGFKYDGYLIILRDDQGHVVMTKASNSVWEKNYADLLNAEKRKAYDRSFSKSVPLHVNFGWPGTF